MPRVQRRAGARRRGVRGWGRWTALCTLVLAFFALATPASARPSDSVTFGDTAAARDACGDPCVFVWVVRTGSGRVTSNLGDGSNPYIDCGTRCQADVYAWVDSVVLTATGGGGFRGWEGCPTPTSGNTCTIPMIGAFVCVKAYFLSGSEVVGACPPPAPPPPPGTGPQTPPPPPPSQTNGPPGLGAPCRIRGTPYADTLRGTSYNDVICGAAGNDRIYGGGGHDLLRGGGGNDRIYGQAHRDRLAGEAGSDVLVGGASADYFLGGKGRDTLVARDRVRDDVNGGSGRDRARVDRRDRIRAIERRY